MRCCTCWKESGAQLARKCAQVGHRMPLARTGIGKALMLDDSPGGNVCATSACRRVGKKSQFWPQHPQQSWEQLEQRMSEYVAGGYAFDLEDNEPSIRCVAAPIRDASKGIVAAISIAVPAYAALEKMAELIPLIKGSQLRCIREGHGQWSACQPTCRSS